MAANELDLPDPEPPTKKINPRLAKAMSFKTAGKPRPSKSGMLVAIILNTNATAPRCIKALTLKRDKPVRLTTKLHSWLTSKSASCCSVNMAPAIACVCKEDKT